MRKQEANQRRHEIKNDNYLRNIDTLILQVPVACFLYFSIAEKIKIICGYVRGCIKLISKNSYSIFFVFFVQFIVPFVLQKRIQEHDEHEENTTQSAQGKNQFNKFRQLLRVIAELYLQQKSVW